VPKQILFLIAFVLTGSVNIHAQFSGYTFLSWEGISFADHQDPGCDTNIIVITNRKFDPQNKDKIYFGNEIDPEGKLRYVVACCNNNKWTLIIKESFGEAIQSAKGGKDFLFFVHGDGQTFPNVLDRCIRIDRLYNINVIAFDWPSRVPGYSNARNFYNSKKNAGLSVSGFEESLLKFRDYMGSHQNGDDSIHASLFVHSLGNHILRKYIETSFDSSFRGGLFDNIILNAPAVRQQGHNKWIERLNFQQRIYITSNQKDRILKGAHLITFRRILGENLGKPLARNANYINFKNLVGNRHNYYLELTLLRSQPGIRFFYNSVFHGANLDPENKARFKKRKDGLGYDIL
jgi:hypothetical protein